MKKITKLAIIIPLLVLSFSVGMLVSHYKFFPFELVKESILITETDKQPPNYIYEINVYDLIKISNERDILTKRKNLVDFIWKEKGFPYPSMPTSIQNNIVDSRYADLDNLKQIDQLTISMKYSVNSIAYLFLAEKTNNQLIIYHQGHDGDFLKGKNTIQFFLKNGYSVLAFSMPLLGMNEQPIVDLPNFGKIKLISHEQFRLLESPNFSPIQYFIEPIAVSLNYIDEKFDFDRYYMIGISGGGWTTILYAALDERISKSYSVAGSLPHHLRFEQKNIGDYEQLAPELYDIANYLELYIMGAYGNDRKLVQIFNKYDPCCFSGELYKTYENNIKQKILEVGKGTFETYLDDSHKEHKISDYSLKLILDSLTN